MTETDREVAHELLVWAEGFTRGLTWEQKIAHIATVLAAQRKAGREEAADTLRDRLARIAQWCDAYPEDIFIPVSSDDMARADKLLADAGISMSAMHAQWARHIVSGIAKLAKENGDAG